MLYEKWGYIATVERKENGYWSMRCKRLAWHPTTPVNKYT